MNRYDPKPETKQPETLAEMRAAMLEDQRVMNEEVLRTMGMPSAQRAELAPAFDAIARELLASMPDSDVLKCFE